MLASRSKNKYLKIYFVLKAKFFKTKLILCLHLQYSASNYVVNELNISAALTLSLLEVCTGPGLARTQPGPRTGAGPANER